MVLLRGDMEPWSLLAVWIGVGEDMVRSCVFQAVVIKIINSGQTMTDG